MADTVRMRRQKTAGGATAGGSPLRSAEETARRDGVVSRWRCGCLANGIVTSLLAAVALVLALLLAQRRARCYAGPSRAALGLVDPCPYGAYYASAQRTCLPCDVQCADCTGGPTGCTACAEGRRLREDGVCVRCPAGTHGSGGRDATCTVCPPGTWAPTGSRSCVRCSGLCATCDATTGGCATCVAGMGRTPAGGCVLCGAGTHGSADGSGPCTACLGACATCDPVGGACTTCVRGRAGVQCAPCAPGTWSPGTLDECEACPSECAECHAATGACTACPPDVSVLFATTCVYPADLAHLNAGCLAFDTSGLRCSLCFVGFGFDAGSGRCFLCASDSTSDGGLSVCVRVCPTGSYDAQANGVCVPCDEGCAACNRNTGECLACEVNYSWVASTPSDEQHCEVCPGASVSDGFRTSACRCPLGAYIDPQAGICTECAPCIRSYPNGTVIEGVDFPCHPVHGTCDGLPPSTGNTTIPPPPPPPPLD